MRALCLSAYWPQRHAQTTFRFCGSGTRCMCRITTSAGYWLVAEVDCPPKQWTCKPGGTGLLLKLQLGLHVQNAECSILVPQGCFAWCASQLRQPGCPTQEPWSAHVD